MSVFKNEKDAELRHGKEVLLVRVTGVDPVYETMPRNERVDKTHDFYYSVRKDEEGQYVIFRSGVVIIAYYGKNNVVKREVQDPFRPVRFGSRYFDSIDDARTYIIQHYKESTSRSMPKHPKFDFSLRMVE